MISGYSSDHRFREVITGVGPASAVLHDGADCGSVACDPCSPAAR